MTLPGVCLEITVVGAIQLPDIEPMRGLGVKMGPYCVLQLGGSRAKTRTAYGGGRNPNWQERIRLDVPPGAAELCIMVWNHSKLSAHEEIARGTLQLPSREQQGDRLWDQRVQMTPAASATRVKGPVVWGGEITVQLQYVAREEDPVAWPSMNMSGVSSSQLSTSCPQDGIGIAGEPSADLIGIGHVAPSSSLSRMFNKLSKPRKTRHTTDGAPAAGGGQALEGMNSLASSLANEGGADATGQSPRGHPFSLHKALDKVMRKVGGGREHRERAQSCSASAGAADDLAERASVRSEDHNGNGVPSRRSSLGSLAGPPEGAPWHPGPIAESAEDRHHAANQSWQDAQMDARKVSSSTQTDFSAHGSTSAAEAVAAHYLSGRASSPPQQQPSPFLRDSQLACDRASGPDTPAPDWQRAASGPAAEPQAQAGGGPSRQPSAAGEGRSRQQSGALPQEAAWGHHMASVPPAPQSPFLAAQASVEPRSASSHSEFARTGSSPSTAGHRTPLTAAAAAAVEADARAHSAQPQPAAGQSDGPPGMQQPAGSRVRLERFDTAYRRNRAAGQEPDQAQAGGGTPERPRASDESSDSRRALTASDSSLEDLAHANGAGPSAGAAAAVPIPIGGKPRWPPPVPGGFTPVQPACSPFAQASDLPMYPARDSSQPFGAGHAGSRASNGARSLARVSTSEPMYVVPVPAPDAVADGLRTLPQRIPPLPTDLPCQGSDELTEEEAAERAGPGLEGPLPDRSEERPAALVPAPEAAGAGAQEDCAAAAAASESVQPPGRGVRKTLSRKSPFLPEVLPNLIDYVDIEYVREHDGRLVLLGEGSFGQVYRATYLHFDVAVKKLNRLNDAKSEEAFRRECAILKGCRNPYIVNFVGVGKDEDGRICLVTELMDENLMSALQLPDDLNKRYHYYAEGKHILQCIATALIYLHKNEIVHLDIKSPNVLLKKGDAKLADVGLSQLLRKSFANSCQGVGTFCWAATELLTGTHPVTKAADVFSFGVLLWEVCTLEQPIMRRMRDIEPHEAPEAVRDLFQACVAEDPDTRPTAKQVLEILQRN